MIDTQVRLPHYAFFESLAQATSEDDPEWRSAKAGLLVLRLLDNWALWGAEVLESNEWGVAVVRRSVRLVDEGHSLRDLIMHVLDEMRAAPDRDPSELIPAVMAYARGLEFEGKWALAADVYDTTIIHKLARPVLDTTAVIGAYMRLGACRRTLAQWEEAAAAYKAAGRLAKLVGDAEHVLRAQLATAKLAMDRGNYPKAQTVLDRIIARAEKAGLEQVRAAALHDRATVAHHRGQYELALRLGYQALAETMEQAQRDRVLADLAASFFELGLHDAARDAHAIVAATAEQQFMRWLSSINLIEIAAMDGQEALFERYRRELSQAALPVALAAHYHLYVGQGFGTFGKADLARAEFEQAVSIASAHGLNEVLIKTEQSLRQLEERQNAVVAARPRESSKRVEWSSDVLDVVAAIHEMKSLAGVAD